MPAPGERNTATDKTMVDQAGCVTYATYLDWWCDATYNAARPREVA